MPPGLGERLGALRRQLGVEDAPDLDVDRVRDVEAGMGTRLPDPVLAILAAQLPFLSEELGVGLGEILRHSAQAREARARGDLVVFGANRAGTVFHGFVIGAADDRIAVFDAGRRALDSFDVVHWLSARASEAGYESDGEGRFEPRLVRAAKPEPEGRRVRHKKWGVGRLLTEEGEGPNRKVKVAFQNDGIKTLAARFLEFVDDDSA